MDIHYIVAIIFGAVFAVIVSKAYQKRVDPFTATMVSCGLYIVGSTIMAGPVWLLAALPLCVLVGPATLFTIMLMNSLHKKEI